MKSFFLWIFIAVLGFWLFVEIFVPVALVICFLLLQFFFLKKYRIGCGHPLKPHQILTILMRFLTVSVFVLAAAGPSDADQNRIRKPGFDRIRWGFFPLVD